MSLTADSRCAWTTLPTTHHAQPPDSVARRARQALPPAIDTRRVLRATKSPTPAPHRCQEQAPVWQPPTGVTQPVSEGDRAQLYQQHRLRVARSTHREISVTPAETAQAAWQASSYQPQASRRSETESPL